MRDAVAPDGADKLLGLVVVAALLLVPLSSVRPAAAGDDAVRPANATEIADVLEHSAFPEAGRTIRTPDAGVPAATPDCTDLDPDGGAPIPIRCAFSASTSTSGMGSGSDAAAGSLQLGFATQGTMQTPQGQVSARPLDGLGSSAHVRVHERGEVAVVDGDGSVIWRRPSMSFFADWPVVNDDPPFTLLGADPVDPHSLWTERGFVVADFTGDGVDDVAVTHLVIPSALSAKPPTSMVTILDGTDGDAVWTVDHEPAVRHLAVQGDRLLVAREDFAHEEVSRLQALTFTSTGDGLEASVEWTATAPSGASWLAMTPIGDHRVAAAWSDVAPGGDGPEGHVVVVDAATGSQLWTASTDGFPRELRVDASRGLLVAHVQDDWADDGDFAYRLVGFEATSGAEVAAVARSGAVLTDLTVGDVAGDGDAEWITTDVKTTERPGTGSEALEEGRVIVTRPADSEPAWRFEQPTNGGYPPTTYYQTDRPVFNPFEATVVDGDVAVGSFEGSVGSPGIARPSPQIDHTLRLLDGATGDVAWRQADDAAYPLYLAEATVDGRSAVLAARSDVTARAYAAADGGTLLDRPFPYEIQASAVHDVDGDGTKDLLVGGESRTVFAVDTESLSTMPTVHWSQDLGGSIDQMELGDLIPGEPGPELVAVARNGVHVLDPDTGTLRYHVPTPARAWTATVADVDGDGAEDVVVPTSSLEVYRGADGERMWTFDPPVDGLFSTAAVTGDGIVAAQFWAGPPEVAPNVEKNLNRNHKAFAFDGATGDRLWTDVLPGDKKAYLWRSVLHDPGIAQANGSGVAFSFAERLTADDPTASPFLSALGDDERPRTFVYDARTGDRLWSSWDDWTGDGANPSGDLYHLGLAFGGQMVEYSYHGYMWLRPDRHAFETGNGLATPEAGLVISHLVPTETVQGQDAVLAVTPGSIWAYDPARSKTDINPSPVARWGAHDEQTPVTPGKVTVADVDEEAGQEIVSHPWNVELWTEFQRLRGIIFASATVGDPHGLGVTEILNRPDPTVLAPDATRIDGSILVGTDVTFQGVVDDPEGDVVDVTFHPNGTDSTALDATETDDGQWETPSYEYETTGTKTVVMRVEDAAGLVATATRTVTVDEEPPEAPSASPLPPSHRGDEPVAGGDLRFEVQADDLDGEVTDVTVLPDGDDGPSLDAEPDPDDLRDDVWETATFTYDEPGARTVVYEVVDDSGNTVQASQAIDVAPNHPPTARVADETVAVDATRPEVPLDPSASGDPNGQAFSAAWQITDGDFSETVWLGTSTSPPEITWEPPHAGVFEATLTATDPLGAEDTATVSVEVDDAVALHGVRTAGEETVRDRALVTGRVVDEAGQAVPGADVTVEAVHGATGTTATASGTTNGLGVYWIQLPYDTGVANLPGRHAATVDVEADNRVRLAGDDGGPETAARTLVYHVEAT